MALALTLDTLEGVDKAVQALYVEKDGKFVLDVDGLEDTTGLKSALAAERTANKSWEKKMAALKDVDPEEYRRLKKEADDRETRKLADKGEFDKLRELQAAKDAEWQKKVDEREARLRKYELDDKVRAAALKAGVRSDRIEKAMALTSRNFQLDEGGTIKVLDSRGEPTLTTLDDFFNQDFKTEMPEWYGASGHTGTGAQGGVGGSPKNALSTLKDQYAAAKASKNGPEMVRLKSVIFTLDPTFTG